MNRKPQPDDFDPDVDQLRDMLQCDGEELERTLEGYDRCLYYSFNDNLTITVQSGKYPDWRRFQRDLLGPCVNVQGHGYAISHVHRRKMTNAEMERDDDIAQIPDDYKDKPSTCIVTLTPIIELIAEGVKGPDTTY